MVRGVAGRQGRLRPRRRARAPLALLAAASVCLAATPAAAQQDADPPAESPAPADPSALGIDLSRVERLVRSSRERTEQNGLNLNVFITVFGDAPPDIFLPQGDDQPFFVGPPAGGPPTAADLARRRTPQEFSAPVMDLSAALKWLLRGGRSE